MAKPLVVVSAPLPQDLREQLAAQTEIIDVPTGQAIVQTLGAERARQVQGILCTVRSKIDRDLLAAMPALRVVSNFAVGFDNVDIPAMNEHGVLMCNTPRCSTAPWPT
ncbi:Phosphonate dehydrogenase [Bordetella trematum]|nr:Phosphonate dehydrogenase [Bordetella trematum]